MRSPRAAVEAPQLFARLGIERREVALAFARRHQHCCVALLGVRLGELLALKWKNIDFEFAALPAHEARHQREGFYFTLKPLAAQSAGRGSVGMGRLCQTKIVADLLGIRPHSIMWTQSAEFLCGLV